MESVKPFLLRIFAFNTFMDILQKIPYKPYNSMQYRVACVVHTEKAWAHLGRTEQLSFSLFSVDLRCLAQSAFYFYFLFFSPQTPCTTRHNMEVIQRNTCPDLLSLCLKLTVPVLTRGFP